MAYAALFKSYRNSTKDNISTLPKQLSNVSVLYFVIICIIVMQSKDRQHNGKKLEDTEGVIRFRKSKKDRYHNGQKLEDTKGVIRFVKQRRTDNTMARR